MDDERDVTLALKEVLVIIRASNRRCCNVSIGPYEQIKEIDNN